MTKRKKDKVQDPVIEVMPEPVPAQWVLKQVEVMVMEEATGLPTRRMATVLEVYTPVGVHISFWEGDSSMAMAKEMNRLAQFNKLGIWDPNRNVPSNGDGGLHVPGEPDR